MLQHSIEVGQTASKWKVLQQGSSDLRMVVVLVVVKGVVAAMRAEQLVHQAYQVLEPLLLLAVLDPVIGKVQRRPWLKMKWWGAADCG